MFVQKVGSCSLSSKAVSGFDSISAASMKEKRSRQAKLTVEKTAKCMASPSAALGYKMPAKPSKYGKIWRATRQELEA